MDKLNRIQQELKAPKNQHNKFGDYKYRSAEDILEAVKPLLGTATLTISDELIHFPSAFPPQQIEIIDFDGKRRLDIVGGDRFYIKATATLKDGEESESASAFAREPEKQKGMSEGQLSGATSSYARKYALNGLFCIDDARDADVTNTHGKEEPKSPRISPDQSTVIQDLMKEKGLKGKVAVSLLQANAGVQRISQIPQDKYDAVIKALEGEPC